MTRGDYSDDYHTFGMEWSDEYIYTWVDSRLAVSSFLSARVPRKSTGLFVEKRS
jgi:hypothetical protein